MHCSHLRGPDICLHTYHRLFQGRVLQQGGEDVEGQREGNTKKTKQMCVRQTSDATEMLDELLSFFHVDSQFPDHTNLQSTHFKKGLARKKSKNQTFSHNNGSQLWHTPCGMAQRSRARTRKQRLCLIMPTHGAALSKLPSRILSRQPQETGSPRFHLYTMVWKWTNASAIVTEQSRVDTWTASADTNLGIEHRLLAAAVELRLRWPWRTPCWTCHVYEHILQKAVIVGWKQAHTEQHIGANDA